jgi:hypothetical protein
MTENLQNSSNGPKFGQNISVEKELELADRILKETLLKGKRAEKQTAGYVSDTVMENVVKNILINKKLPDTDENKVNVKLTIALLAQEGATSPRFTETRQLGVFGVTISVREIREECRRNNTTFRRLARSLANFAIKAAIAFDMDGNLAKSFQLAVPDATKEELIYASDFQTFSGDPALPPRTKTWLMTNFKNRFRGSTEKQE